MSNTPNDADGPLNPDSSEPAVPPSSPAAVTGNSYARPAAKPLGGVVKAEDASLASIVDTIEAIIIALKTIMTEYRGLISFAQNI